MRPSERAPGSDEVFAVLFGGRLRGFCAGPVEHALLGSGFAVGKVLENLFLLLVAGVAFVKGFGQRSAHELLHAFERVGLGVVGAGV